MSHYQSVTTALAVLLLAAPLGAQSASQTTNAQAVAPATTSALAGSSDSTSARAAAGPTRSLPALGVRATAMAIPPVGTPMPAVSTTRNVAMMIVGGAALIVGAVVGGDSGTIIMIGGGALGLYGLWNYLK